MPYSTISELPESVRSTLDEDKQRQWMSVFNAVWDDNPDLEREEREQRALRAAWGAVPTESAEPDFDRTPPKGAQDNARKVLRWRDEHPDEVEAMTRTGWARANQLAKGEQLSWETIGRMAAFERHRDNAEIDPEHESTPWRDNGYVAWLGWGGDIGIRWAQNMIERREERTESSEWRLSEATDFAVHIHSWGTTAHPSGDFTVDREWLKSLQRGFLKLTQHGYKVPVLRQHNEDGLTWGRVIGYFASDDVPAQYRDEVDAEGVYAIVLASKPLAFLHKQGLIQNWSPTFYRDYEYPHTGEVIDLAPRELSFVSIPHQKNLSSPSGFYSEDDEQFFTQIMERAIMLEENEEQTKAGEHEDDEAMMMEHGQLEKLAALIAEAVSGSLKEALPELLAGMKEEDGDEMEGEAENMDGEKLEMKEQQITQLEEKVARLERERKMRDLQAAGLAEDEATQLVELSEEDPEQYQSALVTRLADMRQQTGEQSSTVVLEEVGSSGTADRPITGSPEQKFKKTVRQLKDSGLPAHKAIVEAQKKTGYGQ